ncbi:hypothetical protein LT330_006351 [Penicillium expansum]|nr:hypothetical protein LT330_006351 [Penicillium expansum]
MVQAMVHAMALDTTSTILENESMASLFVQRYVREDMIHFHKALKAVREICDQVLSDHGISHATESRLKEQASLEKKLADRERKQGFSYKSIEDIERDIVDLAGVCILVHIPSTRIKASELLHDAFVVKKMVDHPKQDQVNGGQQANHGYVATHLHVLLKMENIYDRGLQPSDAKPVEIQVISTELRGWTNREHDIIYKSKGKPRLAQTQQLDIMRKLCGISEVMHQQFEEGQTNRAAKDNQSLRSLDEVGWALHKWLEEHRGAWFHGRTAGSCTSLFEFLKSRNMDTRGELRQVLEASFGSDSEAVYSMVASEYPAGSLTLVIFIMDRLLLTGGESSGVNLCIADGDHQIHVHMLQAMMSTFVWLNRLFTPALTWQQVFAAQNEESLRYGIDLLYSARCDVFLDGNPLEKDEIAIIKALWDWFERQNDRQIRLTFAISKNRMFKKRKDARQVMEPLTHGLKHWN